MHISLKKNVLDNRSSFEILYEKEKLIMPIGGYTKAKVIHDIFQEVNDYLDTWNNEEKEILFDHYQSLELTIQSIWNPDARKKKLMEICKEMFKLLDYNRCLNWVTLICDTPGSSITLPKDLLLEYVTDVDRQTTREQTYTKDDYIHLITLSIMMRVYMPFWAVYMELVEASVGPLWKENHCYYLMETSGMKNTPAFTKLAIYTGVIISNNQGKFDSGRNLIAGVGTEQLPDFIIGINIIRRLTTAVLSDGSHKDALLPFIYTYTNNKCKSVDSKIGHLSSKKPGESSTGETDKTTSALDYVRASPNLSDGDKVEFEFAVSDDEHILNVLCPDMNMEILERALRCSEDLLNQEFTSVQIRLAQWVFDPVIPAKAVDYLTAPSLVKIMGFTQAILEHTGHDYLALISTSYIPKVKKLMANISTSDGKHRLTPDLVAELDKIFPYPKQSGGKKATKRTNQAVLAIDHFVKSLSANDWHVSDTLLAKKTFEKRQPNKHLLIRPDIKLCLARLIIDLKTKEQYKVPEYVPKV